MKRMPQWESVLAWFYFGVLMASWWWNTKWLLLVAAILYIIWLYLKASRLTIGLLITLSIVFASAHWLLLFSNSSLPILLRLAIVVFMWSQLIIVTAVLLLRWLLRPQPREA
jgi:hypothetical protein